MKNKKLIIIAGPTASGKTDLAINLALRLNTEIISADSRLVYKDFNIGTAKPTVEEMSKVQHHLINVVDPTFYYTVAIYKDQANKIIDNIHKKGKIPVVAGGTGFYIRSAIDGLNLPDVKPNENLRNELTEFAKTNGNEALHKKLKEIDPITAKKIHQNDIFRISRAIEVHKATGKAISELQTKKPSRFDIHFVALKTENRGLLYQRINQRVLTMLECGLIEEVKFLIDKYGKTLSLLKTLGYKEVVEFLEKKCSYNEMIDNIQKNTRHFARRQLIWFRSDERINWYNIDKEDLNFITEDILGKIEKNDR